MVADDGEWFEACSGSGVPPLGFDIISTAAIFLLTGSSVATSNVKMLVRGTLLHRDFDFVGRWVCVGLHFTVAATNFFRFSSMLCSAGCVWCG